MNLRTCFAKTDNLDTLLIDCEYLVNFCHKVKIYLLIPTWWGEGSPMSFCKYEYMLHSQNLDLMTDDMAFIFIIYDDWKEVYTQLFDQESNYLEFCKTATFTIWFSDWGKNTNYRARERCAQTFLGFTPLLVDGGMTVWGLIKTKTPITTAKMCLQFLSLSSGAKLWFNHEFSFCLIEISPISNPIQ